MNTLDQNLISSSVVIHRIIEDYDVHSMDFMTRIPTWICEALADLNIQQHLINVGKVIDFDEYRCEIPEGCENIRLVTINGKRVDFTTNPAPFEHDDGNYIPFVVSFPIGVNLTENVVFDFIQTISGSLYTYSINGSHLHLNVRKGTLGILFHGLPMTLDEILKINVPLIPNNDVLIDALKNFVMMRILQRNYRHPVLNLRDNNPYTNPALAYDNAKIKVRNACNRLTKDKRDDCSRSLLNFLNMKNHYVNGYESKRRSLP